MKINTLIKSRDIGKWTVEFFILFTSVLAAFFVENYRQEREDEKTYKDYLISTLDDLREDSVGLESALMLVNHYSKIADSLNNTKTESNESTVKIMGHLLVAYELKLKNTTYYGMKVTGDLKLIKNKKLRRQLDDYYYYQEIMLEYKKRYEEYKQQQIMPYLNKFLAESDIYYDYSTFQMRLTKSKITSRVDIVDNFELHNYLLWSRKHWIEVADIIKEFAIPMTIQQIRSVEKELRDL